MQKTVYKKEFISRLDTAEEMSELEVRTIEIISTETQKEIQVGQAWEERRTSKCVGGNIKSLTYV